jgi:formate/nitrite transporter FocA (FNT family)
MPQLQAQYPGLQTLIYSAFGFPLGLFMIVVLGADLWTSNCGYMMVALHEGRCTVWDVIKVGGCGVAA